ncbi:MAG TPA: metal-dependent transcriptional regulator [Balneolaceae bacterium]|nr:metal-dependent transcriptional regulator [Balneolaceae bacterium]
MSRSQSIEDYLKAIYKLQTLKEGGVSTSELAKEMGVANASVTNMVKRLSKLGMVDYQSYYGTTLTKSGEKIALEMIRHHRLLELYLKEMLGYSWDEVHEEAEKLEHYISEQFEDKISELLNHPTVDPHGDPIPTKDGEMPVIKSKKLSSVLADYSCIVQRVKNQDSDVLRKLEQAGIIPGVKVTIVKRDEEKGCLHLEVEGRKTSVADALAAQIYVV